MLRAEVMKVFLCIRSPHPDWGLGSGGEKKKNVGKQIKSRIISSHTEISHYLKNNSPQVTQKNLNQLANYVKNSWPENEVLQDAPKQQKKEKYSSINH